MRILTPTGYKDISACSVGDDVSAFDTVTGAPIVNQVESIQWVDAAEWARWWQVEPSVPSFDFYLINGTWTLNSEQSIWRNADNVCHARDLVVGDVIFDDTNANVTITSIAPVTATGWWRFDISGDHSYIVDGLTLHNASRFWVLGTASWTAGNTANWAATTGAAGGQTVPGSADTVTFDGSSGGGTVTVNFGGTITVQSITSGAFTGTLDFSANNNSVTLSASAGMNGTGSATRTVNLGSGTWTLTGTTGTIWNFNTVTGLTFNAGTSTIVLTATAATTRTFTPGTLTYSTVSLSANSSGGAVSIGSSGTIATLNITAPNYLGIGIGNTLTVTNALNINGTSLTALVGFSSGTVGTAATISSANSGNFTWCTFHDMTFSGGGTFTATNSISLGNNTGITITAPSAGGGPVARTNIIQRGTPY